MCSSPPFPSDLWTKEEKDDKVGRSGNGSGMVYIWVKRRFHTGKFHTPDVIFRSLKETNLVETLKT